jgi:hypothetical protein
MEAKEIIKQAEVVIHEVKDYAALCVRRMESSTTASNVILDNLSYFGDIENGKPHGFGVIKWKNGEIYAGNIREGERKAGMLESDEFTYEGQFSDNKFQGWGQITSKANGEKMVGEFADGQYHGKGVYTWPDGRRYEG